MKPRPRVSVLTPFFDTPVEFLAEAVESVLAQTYRGWELLLVDDGSTGDSVSFARRCAADHAPAIRYLDHPGHRNLGVAATLNTGLARAEGELLTLLDADDVWLPHKLEEQVALMDAHPGAGMLYGNTLYWHSWSGEGAESSSDYLPDLGITDGQVVAPPRLLPLFLSGRVAVPCTCSVMVRLPLARSVGGFEAAARGLYADQRFYAKICLTTPVLVSAACWDLYRQHGGSRCHSASPEELREHRQNFLDWVDTYLSARGIRDPLVWRALRRERWKLRHPALARAARTGRRLRARARRALPIGGGLTGSGGRA